MQELTFGDRMKLYEKQNLKTLMPTLPVCCRVDGKCFHSFCKDLKKPYDERLVNLMRVVTQWIVEETNACIGYTQSDEISLIMYSDNLKSQIFFDGDAEKIDSIVAALVSVKFNSLLEEFDLGHKKGLLPVFDCRVWNVPSLLEATNYLIWRENDTTRNSVSSAARAHYSHKEVNKKKSAEMQEMLFQKGINWNDYPVFFKRGSYFQKRKVLKPFTKEELDRLPEKHEARKNPDLMVERSEVREIHLPIFSKLENRIGVVFNGEEPKEARETLRDS